MPDITLEEIQEKFDSLPESLRLAIIVAGADKKVNAIGREHGLNVRQISELLLKTHIVMFGFVHPDKFIEGVNGITGIPPQVVKGIVRDINDQIFKDIREDLIALAEQPQKAEEVESFIQESTPGGKSLTPEELSGPATISQTQITQVETIEDKKNDEILKSAGIEIPSLGFGNEIGNKLPIQKEETAKVAPEAKEPVASSKENLIPMVSEPSPVVKEKTEEKEVDVKENAEVMKIAFESLPKEDVVIPEFKIIEQPPSEEKKVPHDIYNTVTPETKIEPAKAPAFIPPIIETKPESVPIIETPKPIIEKAVVTTQAPIQEKTEAPAEEKKEIKVVTPEKQTEPVETPESVPPVDNSGTDEEKKKSADLKLAVKNIIEIYQQKSKGPQPEVTYSNQEEEKRAIVMQIVEVQDNIKKMKDRFTQLIKEKTKLEKDKKEISSKDGKNVKQISEINTNLSDLAREEKMIQILRESILPKEYLDLLVKLDKLNTHNPPENAHK